jgi:hypothetical protein
MPDILTITGDQCEDCCACRVARVDIQLTWLNGVSGNVFTFQAFTDSGYGTTFYDTGTIDTSTASPINAAITSGDPIGKVAGPSSYLGGYLEVGGTTTDNTSVTVRVTVTYTSGETTVDTKTVDIDSNPNPTSTGQYPILIDGCSWV